jgi:hypothetical protein
VEAEVAGQVVVAAEEAAGRAAAEVLGDLEAEVVEEVERAEAGKKSKNSKIKNKKAVLMRVAFLLSYAMVHAPCRRLTNHFWGLTFVVRETRTMAYRALSF